MPKPNEFFKISYDFFTIPNKTNSKKQDTLYYPIIQSTDFGNTEDYYKLNVYKNNELYNTTTDITLFKDTYFNGNDFKGNFKQFTYNAYDTMKIELLKIPSSTYDYLFKLTSRTVVLGTNSSNFTTRLQSNLHFTKKNNNLKVLGYFSVASIQIDSLIVLPLSKN